MSPQDYAHNLAQVNQRIQQACLAAGRPATSVSLLAVSKTQPESAVAAFLALGQTAFGENYLQDALPKITAHPDAQWHFIGPIQSNKTKPIAEHFDWVESVDRLKIAQRLSDQRPSDKPALNILLQINISEEASKSGFLPNELMAVAQEIAQLPGLVIRGLMAIPAATDDPVAQRQPFAHMRRLFEQLQQTLPNQPIDTLSMGMSGDLEAAILEGSTQVRIGTDLFGARRI
ncbi:YggS family pyridoxal phosphate-dependent enzyme [Thiomicrospira cyclica]|uniref:Pyridoxal phosphate homeostasis protein n=1 Tax=Thiomicrospira cyclica (strain DSM 14477 / JCM 11371 / ALM1) TaxID=717773 RepID=F6DAB1_THICA|nr:YggS family pyridoxal phosphate-dependent enzyme [Thiomicrospira cyclica]AEG31077.1 protein of unknown function UPF0001 [Thiomicrospira cyclica ALM1]